MVLVGDHDRELAAGALRRHFVHGRLSAAELAERLDVALRARSRDELDAAMVGLPPVWEDLPAGVHAAVRRARHGVRRASFLLALVRVWFRLNLALLLAFGIALIVGAPLGTALGAVLAAWVLAGFACWRVWRRDAFAPSPRGARMPRSR